jgi:hypothetical protein
VDYYCYHPRWLARPSWATRLCGGGRPHCRRILDDRPRPPRIRTPRRRLLHPPPPPPPPPRNLLRFPRRDLRPRRPRRRRRHCPIDGGAVGPRKTRLCLLKNRKKIMLEFIFSLS